MAVGAGQTHWVVVSFADVSTAEKKYFVVPEAVKLLKVWTTIEGAITGADADVIVENAAAAVAATVTIANSGSAAGTIDSVVPTANNTWTAGTVGSVETDGASTGAQSLTVTLEFSRGSHAG